MEDLARNSSCQSELDWEKYVLIFTHVPRTGGSTFGKIAAKSLGVSVYGLPKFVPLPGSEAMKATFAEAIATIHDFEIKDFSNVKLLAGHMPYGIHRLLPKHPIYVSLLRHPVDRFISMYYFFKKEDFSEMAIHEAATSMDLNIFVRENFNGGDFITQNEHELTTSTRPC